MDVQKKPLELSEELDLIHHFASNSDEVLTAKNGEAEILKSQPIKSSKAVNWLVRAGVFLKSFVRGSAKEDWHAAAFALISSVPSNVFAGLSIVALSPMIARLFGGSEGSGFIFATSSLAVILGYGSYLVGYYLLMAYKERTSDIKAGRRFDRRRFLRVVTFDFLAHLPNDVFTMTSMGAVQAGLFASGSADMFWSIFTSQLSMDLLYCVKEPLYWRAAKEMDKMLVSQSYGNVAYVNTDDILVVDKAA
jgi:hypothetical protein